MSSFAVILLAVALGVDAFSVCLGIGLVGINRRRSYLLISTVAIFHVLMPLAGWWIGKALGVYLGRLAGVLGAGLLFFLGGRMIYGAMRGNIPGGPSVMLPGAVGLLSLGASVSMDALTVGFTLGIYHFEPLLTAAVVGFVAGLMTALGLGLGRLIRAWVGQRAQLIGGLILFGVGINLLR